MEYHVYGERESQELRRPRPGTKREVKVLLRQVDEHAEAAQRRILAMGQATGSLSQTQQDLLQAATMAWEKQRKAIRRRWREHGEIRPWDAVAQKFQSALNGCLTDLHRKELRHRGRRAPMPPSVPDYPDEWTGVERLAEAAREQQERARYWDRFDDQGLEVADPYRPVASQVVDAMAPPLFAVVAARTLRVLGERDRRPCLTPDEGRVSRFLQEMDWSIIALTDADTALGRHFTEPTRWRHGLAGTTGMPVQRVYKATEKLLDHVRLGFYLFILLAPLGHAVVDTDEIDDLYDLTHFPSPRWLSASECMLLRKAGVTLTTGPRLRVDTGAFVRLSKKELKRVADWPGEMVVRALHDAELAYTVHVPEQTDPPAFQCVLACATHESHSKADR